MRVKVVTVPPGRYADRVEATAYHIVAEAVANADKHSRAEDVEVSIVETQAPRRLRIDVRDHGVDGATLGRGTGLPGMRDRAIALGGDLHLSSPAGAGTHITEGHDHVHSTADERKLAVLSTTRTGIANPCVPEDRISAIPVDSAATAQARPRGMYDDCRRHRHR